MTAKEMHLHSPFSPPPTHHHLQARSVSPSSCSETSLHSPGEEAGVCHSLCISSAWVKRGHSTAEREKRGFPEWAYWCARCTHVQMYIIHTSLQLHSNLAFYLLIHTRNDRPQPDIHHNLVVIKQRLAGLQQPLCSSAASQPSLHKSYIPHPTRELRVDSLSGR